MTSVQDIRQSSFCDSVYELIGRAECRPVLDAGEREEVFRLRYAAYRREGALPLNAPEIFRDRFDQEPNSTTFGIYVDGRLASSLRIHVVNRFTPEHPGLHVFPDHLSPLIDAGQVLIDPTRFVIDAVSSRRYPKLPYVTVRLAWLACEWFRADKLLATVRSEHQAFYKRLFGHRIVCSARPYPTLTKPLGLMVLDYRLARDKVVRRYPFFSSTLSERQSLFARCSKITPTFDTSAIALVA